MLGLGLDGRTAQEFEPDGKAAEEIESLYTWLCGMIQVRQDGFLAVSVRQAAIHTFIHINVRGLLIA
jgi:hypothetical protein